MSNSERPRGLGAAARVTALAGSVMDLHVKIALQEMDREKRRLISGGIFLLIGGIFMSLTLLGVETTIIFWMKNTVGLNIQTIIIWMSIINLLLAGLAFRIGGQLAKGPYLPDTLEGLAKTTKAVLGKKT